MFNLQVLKTRTLRLIVLSRQFRSKAPRLIALFLAVISLMMLVSMLPDIIASGGKIDPTAIQNGIIGGMVILPPFLLGSYLVQNTIRSVKAIFRGSSRVVVGIEAGLYFLCRLLLVEAVYMLVPLVCQSFGASVVTPGLNVGLIWFWAGAALALVGNMMVGAFLMVVVDVNHWRRIKARLALGLN